MNKTGKIFLNILFLLTIGVAAVFGYAMLRSEVAGVEMAYEGELSKSRLFNQSAQQTISDLIIENEQLKRENNKLIKENEQLLESLVGCDDPGAPQDIVP